MNAFNEHTHKKGNVNFNIMLVTDTAVEDVSTEHHPVEKYLSNFAAFFMPLTLLRGALQYLAFEFSPLCLNKWPSLEFIQLAI